MKNYFLLFYLVPFSIFIHSASMNSKKEFRKHVLSDSLIFFRKKCDQFNQAKSHFGSPDYQKKLYDVVEEIVDFSEIVCDGATHFHEEKVSPQDMMFALEKLKNRSLTPISKPLVQDFLKDVSKITW